MADGRTTEVIPVRAPKEMVKTVRDKAQKSGKSVNQWMVSAIEGKLRSHHRKDLTYAE